MSFTETSRNRIGKKNKSCSQILEAVKTKRRLHFRTSFTVIPYGQSCVESSRQKSTHSQTHIALFAQQTLQWHILLNLLYISRHLVNTKVGTFGFVQKETRFQPNQIVFFYLCFRD